MIPRKTPALGMPIGTLIFFAMAFSLSLYFIFAAIQGDYGLFRRAEVEAEHKVLERELATLQARVDKMQNLTHRLSDDYLDVDLLDERARDTLGYVRAEEIVIH